MTSSRLAAQSRLRTACPPTPWLLVILVASCIAYRSGFYFPVGRGWMEESIDLIGVLLAVSGAAAAGAMNPNEERRGVLLGAWAVGAGCALVLGQIILAAGLTLAGLVHYFLRRASLDAPKAACEEPFLARCRKYAVSSGPRLCGLAAAVLLFELWEDAPGAIRVGAEVVEVGLIVTVLALLGIAWMTGARRIIPSELAGGPPAASRMRWIAFAGVLLALFLALGLAVAWTPLGQWDAEAGAWFYRSGGKTVTKLMRRFSSAGGRDLVLIWLPLLLLFMTTLRKTFSAGFVCLSMLGAVGLELFFKGLFQRARPAFTSGVHLDSFPSGHVLAATVLAAALLVVLLPQVKARWGRVLLWAAVLTWPLLMAMSRVYLGRHFPADVAGSLLLGIAWVLGCRALVQLLSQSRFGIRCGIPAACAAPSILADRRAAGV